MSTDPRTPCIIGVGRRTWHPGDVGPEGAPEPLAMWDEVAHLAAADTQRPAVLARIESLDVVYCETWQYDDPPARLAERLGASPRRAQYSGIGGTTPQQLVSGAAESIRRGDLDLALVVSAEALATKRAYKKRGERPAYSFGAQEKRPYPLEAPMHPVEIAHEVFQAWLTFAVFDNARRAHLGIGLDEYRRGIGEMMAPMTRVAAANPHAWFPVDRSVADLVAVRPDNRMVGYPYTKYMVSIMDVDMAAAVLVASEVQADALGVPKDRRVYPRGWCYATDPVYVAEHDDLWRSPAMAAASAEALRVAGLGIDDVAHLDLYSCFASSLHFARDALGLAPDDTRPLTVTGGLPYHGGPGSGYLTHAIAEMADVLRADPGTNGLVSGVGMHMTKHVYGVYSTAPATATLPDDRTVQNRLDAGGHRVITPEHTGPATVAAYSVVHGRDGAPEWALLVCDLADGTRTYAKALDPDFCTAAETGELVGEPVTLEVRTTTTAMGESRVNVVA